MAKDLEEEERKKEEEQEEERRKVTWWEKVPTIWKVVGAVIIFIKFQQLSQEGGNYQQLFLWAAVIAAILYFMGAEGRRREVPLLTPEEAEIALEEEIERKKRSGQLDRFTPYHIGINNGLFFFEGMPRHYIIELRVGNIYKKATVIAEGTGRGYVTIQGNPGKLQGTEQIPVRTPAILKELKRYSDSGLDKFLFPGVKK